MIVCFYYKIYTHPNLKHGSGLFLKVQGDERFTQVGLSLLSSRIFVFSPPISSALAAKRQELVVGETESLDAWEEEGTGSPRKALQEK